jgi:hypothetical protein
MTRFLILRENKKGNQSESLIIIGAGKGNRTPTQFPEPDFESGASTSSATPAYIGRGAKYM